MARREKGARARSRVGDKFRLAVDKADIVRMMSLRLSASLN